MIGVCTLHLAIRTGRCQPNSSCIAPSNSNKFGRISWRHSLRQLDGRRGSAFCGGGGASIPFDRGASCSLICLYFLWQCLQHDSKSRHHGTAFLGAAGKIKFKCNKETLQTNALYFHAKQAGNVSTVRPSRHCAQSIELARRNRLHQQEYEHL